VDFSFAHHSGSQVRTIAKGKEIWFVAKDVCDILEINNPSDALKRLDEDEKVLVSNEGFRGLVNVINESRSLLACSW
jgi:anti-repressor protein